MNNLLLQSNIILQYPKWFILLCVLVGILYATALYYRDQSFGEQSQKLNRLLGGIRFGTVTIICLLLLSPVIKRTITQTEQPIVVLAQDNSESIGRSMSEEARQKYQKDMDLLKQQLASNYDLKTYSFGAETREGIDHSYTDQATNIASFMQEMYDLYSNQNIGTVIWASDGIYNQGSNPIYLGNKLNTPIFSIALGDTIPKKDLILKKVYNNQITYLGDRFNVQIDLAAINCSATTTKLVISKGGKKIQEKIISLENNDFFATEEITLEATSSGVQKYTVSLSAIEGEATTANNSKNFYIDVLDARQKILLLAESPHPDMAAFKRTIKNNKNYEVEIKYADDFSESVTAYDFVILHQLPSARNGIPDILTTIRTKKIPHLFVVGTLTNLPNLNQSQGLIAINSRGNQTNDTEGILEPTFNLFTLDDKVKDLIAQLPPVTTPFADFKAKADATVMMRQRIGSINMDYPLVIVGEEQGIKKGILTGEGIWKWRIFDYVQNQSHELFDELFGKVIQYLSTKEDKRKFRAFASNTLYNENESIVVDAELYNNNYERINTPEARLVITNDKGEKFPFTFNKTESSYELNAGRLPEGSYQFEASTVFNGEELKSGGAFSVKAIQLEIFESTANHQLLNLISSKNGGTVIGPNELLKLPELIKTKGFAKPVLYDTIKTRSLIHLKWIFFLLLGLLTLEWFLRRYFGSY
ncbi:hypothetical protein [Aureispira anguillae]|uniref:VWA domain-containing protein n=1 Tax=Aureispira anguillae TaxID=2864201 RepID=A0A915YK66_9BACT|nr:hypothetical protein [Aureispira anguillae]BDS14509.1 hypothetical protein AsAng_0052890 [Aureispira anguillae]